MSETVTSIASWADATFGPANSTLRAAIRANEEMAELLHILAIDDSTTGILRTMGEDINEKAIEEIADVVIVLCRVARNLGCKNIWTEVEKKMAINRGREWKADGTGHGYHIK